MESDEIETCPVKVFKVEVLVIAHNRGNSVTKEDIINELEYTDDLGVSVLGIDENSVGWHDDHPLNYGGEKMKEAVKELFGS
jgi:hypothetical protein